MDINDLVLTDEALGVIDSGAWVGDLLEAPGLELKVCGLRSKDARRALEQKQAQARAKNRGKPLSDEQLAVCMRETLAEVVLKDWRGLSSGGEPVEYSREQAAKWLTSRNGERFAALVLQAAQQIDDQANSFVEAATKN